MPFRIGGKAALRIGARAGCMALVLLIWLPAFVFMAGVALARITGCRATEAGPEPCVVHGVDLGRRLYDMTMMGWVVAILSPLLLLSLIGMVVLFVRFVLRWRSGTSSTAHDTARNQ